MTTATTVSSTEDVAPVAPQHRFDEAALARFMARAIDGFAPPLTVAQFEGGMSNPTFLLSGGGGRYVLRKRRRARWCPRRMRSSASSM